MKTQTISIFSTKHGVGCSTLAYNLGLLLNQRILEPDSGMLSFFANARAHSKEGSTYYVDKISKVKPHNYKQCIIDAGNHLSKATLEKVIKSSEVILIPSSYDHATLIHTVASLKIAFDINPNALIVVVFNRLDSSDTTTEKTYTKYAWERMKRMIENDNIRLIIRQAFIRSNFLYFEFAEGGYYFLDHFFSTNDVLIEGSDEKMKRYHCSVLDERMMKAQINAQSVDSSKERQKIAKENIQHLLKIQKMYSEYSKKHASSKYDYAIDFESMLDTTNLYSKDTMYHNRKVVKDMLELLENINAIQ